MASPTITLRVRLDSLPQQITLAVNSAGVFSTSTQLAQSFQASIGLTGPQGPAGSSGTVADATTSTKGKLQLAGDLGGTAANPQIKRTHKFIVAAHGDSDPADYTCAGSTGNESEINNAIVAANAVSGGAQVWLRGSFTVSGNGIVPMSNVTLTSDGTATIQHDNSSSSYSDIGSKPIIRNTSSSFSNFGVENLTFLGNTLTTSTSCSIYLDGDNDPDATTPPVITNFWIRNCNFRNNSSLPVRLFGLRGKLMVTGCEFNGNADAGFGWNEEVIFTGNHSINSRDNGFSLSRGNKKVVCVGNTSENATFWGIWLGGFGNEDGPSYVTCTGNVIRNSGKSGIGLINAPRHATITGNTIDMNHNRPTDSDCDGIQIRGASLEDYGNNIVVSGNTILNAARAGISYGWVSEISITDNLIVDTGTQFKANGSTTISSSDTTSNVGVLQFHPTTNVWIDGNSIIDTRGTPYCNLDIYPIQSSTMKVGQNYSHGMRVSRNTLDLTTPVETGNELSINANGPDTNIDIQLNAQGNGEVQARGTSGLNIESTATGTGTSTLFRMSAGTTTAKVAGITAKRQDPAASALMAFNLLTGSVLTPSDTTAPFYLLGQSGGGSQAGFNTGMLYKRRAVSDAATTVTKTDFMVAYTSLTSGHTVTMPTAIQTTGQTFVIKDETGTAATNNITINPFSLGSPTFTDTDVDATANVAHLSTNIVTGTPITLSTAGTLPAPLAPATTYYITRNSLNLINSPLTAGTTANDSSSGKVAWQNTANAAGSDNAYATWTSDGNIDPSDPRGDTQTFSGSITAASKNLTAGSSVFFLTDVGKYVRIPGAGASGSDLITTIATFTDATHVVLTAAAGTTVTSVTSAFGSGDLVTSQILKLTNFGFSIPTAANIEGVKVTVERKSTTVIGNVNLVYDVTAQLVKGGTIQGNNYAITGTAWPSSDAQANYGGTSDNWGLTLTPTDVNASNFGFAFQVDSTLGTANVDNVIVTVYYTLPNDVKFATSLANALAGTAIDLTTTGSGTFTIAGVAQTIDGASSYKIDRNYGTVVLYSDGANYFTRGGIHIPAGSLKSATTTVDVAAATAPSANQVLTATDSTHATWQTPYSNPMTTLGDILYENSTPAATRLAGNTTSTNKFLTQTGTGSVSAAPAWNIIVSGDIPNNAADTTGKSAKTDALNSATTVVNVSSASAPSSGQVLTATDSTHATWQASAGGPPSGSAGGDLTGTYPNPTLATATLAKIGYSLQAAGLGFSPADSTTYYIGTGAGHSPVTTDGNGRVLIPKAGKVTDVYVTFFNTATTPTSETSTVSFRLNHTSDTTISSSVNINSATTSPQTYSITGQSITVAAGDSFEIKWVTPAWVTNPTGVRIAATVFIQTG